MFSMAMRILSVAFALILVVLYPAVSPAVTLAGESNTYLQFREPTDHTRLAPFYEYLNFRMDDFADNSVAFHFGGWGKVDLYDKSYGQKNNEDLQYAYVSFTSTKNNTVFNIGRIYVTEGVSAEKVDGIYYRTDLRGGFSVSSYAGHPVEEVLNANPGNFVFGGRLGYQIPSFLNIGFSGLKENGGSFERDYLGGDLWLQPVKSIDITGRSSYNAITDGWMEHAYRLSMGPYGSFRLNSEASWINYKDYFASQTSAVFNFLPGVLDPDETLRILGQEVVYSLNDNFALSADYKNYGYHIQGDADYYGGKLTYAVPGSGGAGFTAHRMQGQTDSLKYDEYRIYGYKKFGKADFTIDLLDIYYDQHVNGVKNAYTATFAAGLNMTDKVRLAADVDYNHNPVYKEDFRTLLHLVCRFDTMYGSNKEAK